MPRLRTTPPTRKAAPSAARSLFVISIVARLPVPMLSIGLLVHAERITGSFAAAGVVAAVFAAALGAGGPLLARTAHPKVIGIGESGLDYYYEHAPKEVQAQVFRAHIEAARTSGLPLIVHTRDADRDTIAILTEAMASGPFIGVIHCYSSSPELAWRALELGLYLGIGGILTFRRSDELRATVRELPLERLLLETDAPYLAPEPFRGKRNEPAYVARVAARLAEIKGISVAEVERATTANFFRLFGKAQAPDAGPCG